MINQEIVSTAINELFNHTGSRFIRLFTKAPSNELAVFVTSIVNTLLTDNQENVGRRELYHNILGSMEALRNIHEAGMTEQALMYAKHQGVHPDALRTYNTERDQLEHIKVVIDRIKVEYVKGQTE